MLNIHWQNKNCIMRSILTLVLYIYTQAVWILLIHLLFFKLSAHWFLLQFGSWVLRNQKYCFPPLYKENGSTGSAIVVCQWKAARLSGTNNLIGGLCAIYKHSLVNNNLIKFLCWIYSSYLPITGCGCKIWNNF